jgi:hypothetical protein
VTAVTEASRICVDNGGEENIPPLNHFLVAVDAANVSDRFADGYVQIEYRPARLPPRETTMPDLGPFAVRTGWAAIVVATIVLALGGSINDAGIAMMAVAPVAVTIAAQRGEP